jgi:NAD(P)-dependent dehydrogenase (short-subunit alcohol dehydrogenase family)
MTSPVVLITGALAGIGRATAFAFAGGEAGKTSLTKLLPAQRLGRPEEVAAAIVFVAIGKAGFMMGHSLSVDGAFTA